MAMIEEPWWWFALALALALASYSIRVTVKAVPAERPWRVVLLLLTAGLGVSVCGTVDWSYWPLGMIGGLALVELGEVIWTGITRAWEAAVKVVIKVVVKKVDPDEP